MGAQSELGRRPPAEELARTIQKYVGNVKKMHDFCEARRIEFLLVLQPELGQKPRRNERENELLAAGIGIGDYAASFPELYEEFRSCVGSELRSSAVPQMDISNAQDFIESDEELFSDVVHTSLSGNRLIARLIRSRLEELER